MKIKHLFLLVIICIFKFSAFAQKIEKEKLINKNKFPDKALKYLNQHFDQQKGIKYYREKTEDSVFYESKFNCNGEFFSVKFYTNGVLYDIEKIINKEQISDEAWKKINTKFDHDFKRWKVTKIQKRFYDNSEEYEIIAEGKLKKQVKVFEYHFSEEGIFLSKEEVEGRFTDILFF